MCSQLFIYSGEVVLVDLKSISKYGAVGENKKTQFVVFKNEIYYEAKAIAMR